MFIPNPAAARAPGAADAGPGDAVPPGDAPGPPARPARRVPRLQIRPRTPRLSGSPGTVTPEGNGVTRGHRRAHGGGCRTRQEPRGPSAAASADTAPAPRTGPGAGSASHGREAKRCRCVHQAQSKNAQFYTWISNGAGLHKDTFFLLRLFPG